MTDTTHQNLPITEADEENVYQNLNDIANSIEVGRTLYLTEIGEDIDQYEVVCVKEADDLYWLADGNDTTLQDVVGIMTANRTDGQDGYVWSNGAVVTYASWNWTLSSAIFLSDTPGALTQTPGTNPIMVGWPLAPTIMVVHIARLNYALAHIADPASAAAQTQDALTDNGGGSADQTVDSQAAPTTLTDSTGYSGTHDDTLAATTVPSALTENGGAIGGTNDGDLPALVDPAGDAGASVIAGIRENATMINTIIALLAVLAQNTSDTGQKIIEIVTLAGTAQNNLKEVTTQLGKIKTDVAAVRTGSENNNTAIDSILARLEVLKISATA